MPLTFVRSLLLLSLVLTGCKGGDGDKPSKKPPVTKPPLVSETPLHRSVSRALDMMAALETKKDVTCWTSFRQLDWFISEKSYSEFATLTKIAAMKALLRGALHKARTASARRELTAEDFKGVSIPAATLDQARRADLTKLAANVGLKDYNDYSQTAEHWRVVIGVLQDEIRHGGGGATVSDDGLRAMAELATRLSLMLLKRSGAAATAGKRRRIEGKDVQDAFRSLSTELKLANPKRAPDTNRATAALRLLPPLTKKLIDGKVAALRSYNKGAAKVLADLNKVSRLPLTRGAAGLLLRDLQSLAHFVSAGFEPMRADNYLQDGSFARSKLQRKRYLDAAHVQNVLAQLFPHEMQNNGDILVRFAPNPGTIAAKTRKPFELRLLDHEMNGVRDSAIHWIAMQRVWKEKPFAMDPFAAEYLSEVLSMAMAVYLRRAEAIAKQHGVKEITASVARRVRDKRYVMVPPLSQHAMNWSAANKQAKTKLMAGYKAPLFVDISGAAGFPTKLPTGKPKASFDIQTVMGAGIAVGDINGDGYPDLFIAGEQLGRLMVNRGKSAPGKFTDATKAWGIPADLDDARGCLFFDMDGDGDLDLLIVRSEQESLTLRNDGTKFAAADMGLKTGRGAHVATVFDYDKDGDLDIYIGYYGNGKHNAGQAKGRNLPSLDGRNGTANQMWRMESDGRYVEVGAEAGVADTGWTLAASIVDYDKDGDLDLYLANDFGPNVMLRNDGAGKFTDATEATGTGDRGSGMNVAVADIDGNGYWDFYVTNIDMFAKRIKVVFPTDQSEIDIDASLVKAFQYLNGNKLYMNKAGGKRLRSEEHTRFEPGDRGWGWDGRFFDYDNDGDEDMYMTNGWIPGSSAADQKNIMFLRDGDLFFVAPDSSAEAFAANSRSAVAVDIDRDGDLDLIVNNFRRAPVVLENRKRNKHNWVGIGLKGPGKNSRGIGATIVVKAGDKKWMRQLSCGNGYLGQQDEVLHVGLAGSKIVDVEVRWPDGKVTTRKAVAAGKIHRIER